MMTAASSERTVLVVAGPTASGKSRLALALARRLDGVIVNADSMQVYRGLEVLTDQPGAAARDAAPHRLYGVLDAAARCSAGAWREMARREIETAREAGRAAIVTGGSGLYLKALVEGIADIPAVPEAVRKSMRARLESIGAAAFHDELARRDPEGAASLHAGDTQRLLRAAEVLAATGRPLAAWQAEARARRKPDAMRFRTILLSPPRDRLYAAIDARLERMMAEGAVGEAAALAARGLDPSLPAMKALGVAEFAALDAGRLGPEEALRRARTRSRQYAKRQATWFRTQMISDIVVSEQFSERKEEKIITEILKNP